MPGRKNDPKDNRPAERKTEEKPVPTVKQTRQRLADAILEARTWNPDQED